MKQPMSHSFEYSIHVRVHMFYCMSALLLACHDVRVWGGGGGLEGGGGGGGGAAQVQEQLQVHKTFTYRKPLNPPVFAIHSVKCMLCSTASSLT